MSQTVTQKNCTRQTSPGRFVFCLFAVPKAYPDGRNFYEIARVEENDERIARMFRRLLWRIPFEIPRCFCVVQKCFVSWSKSKLGFEPLRQSKAGNGEVSRIILSTQLAQDRLLKQVIKKIFPSRNEESAKLPISVAGKAIMRIPLKNALPLHNWLDEHNLLQCSRSIRQKKRFNWDYRKILKDLKALVDGRKNWKKTLQNET